MTLREKFQQAVKVLNDMKLSIDDLKTYQAIIDMEAELADYQQEKEDNYQPEEDADLPGTFTDVANRWYNNAGEWGTEIAMDLVRMAVELHADLDKEE